MILEGAFTCSLVQCESTLREVLGLSQSGRVRVPCCNILPLPSATSIHEQSGSAGVASLFMEETADLALQQVELPCWIEPQVPAASIPLLLRAAIQLPLGADASIITYKADSKNLKMDTGFFGLPFLRSGF